MAKKMLALALCCALCLGLLPGAARAADESQAETLAEDLSELGLFRGATASDAADYALDRTMTRAEALVMLVRLMGKEAEAQNGNWTHPFTDVPDWAAAYVGYAYQTGLTKGISETEFGPEEPAGGAAYLTYVLRALGYQDDSEERWAYDFLWSQPFALATYCGILPLQVHTDSFLREDAVLVSYAALTAARKGTNETLAEQLMDAGVFTRAQYESAVDENVFADSRAVNAAIHTAVLANERKPEDAYSFAVESHEILETVEEDDILTVSAMVCYRLFTFTKFGEEKDSSVDWIPASITLRALPSGGYEALAYRTPGQDGDEQAAAVDALFSAPVARRIHTVDFSYMLPVCTLQKQAYLAAGTLEFQHKTCADAVEELVSTPYATLEAQLIAPDYGVVLYRLVPAGMHGLTPTLCLVTNDKSPMGEAQVISFPLPGATIYLSAAPEQLALNEAGDILTYQVTFGDDFIVSMGEEESSLVIHRKGTYYYTADLATGETVMTFSEGP